MAAPSPTTTATTHYLIFLARSLLRLPLRAIGHRRAAASTMSPPASATGAVEEKPTVLMSEKVRITGLALLWEFTNVGSPPRGSAPIPRCAMCYKKTQVPAASKSRKTQASNLSMHSAW